MVLGNCPFHRLAQGHTALICSMKLALFQGLLEGLSAKGLVASPATEPDGCCVAVSLPPRRGSKAPEVA